VEVLRSVHTESSDGGASDTESVWARVAVHDHGMGIPADQFDRIFTRFGRASNGRESAISGTGLGLYLSRELIERQGGGCGLSQGNIWAPPSRLSSSAGLLHWRKGMDGSSRAGTVYASDTTMLMRASHGCASRLSVWKSVAGHRTLPEPRSSGGRGDALGTRLAGRAHDAHSRTPLIMTSVALIPPKKISVSVGRCQPHCPFTQATNNWMTHMCVPPMATAK
jgi:hypothetical protein